MKRHRDPVPSRPSLGSWLLLIALGFGVGARAVRAQPEELDSAEDFDLEAAPLFDWDLLSLEQNNPRLNAGVLTGFHSVRSAGVTPHRGWKIGFGLHYVREELVDLATQRRLSDSNQVVLTPKLNYGFLPRLEAGLGVSGGYVAGRLPFPAAGGGTEDRVVDNFDLSSVDLGVKWLFFEGHRLRLAVSLDSRLAIDRGEFGNLPGSFFNLEIDADYSITNRFALVGNLQFLTSDAEGVDNQVVADVAATYSFSDQFRGMLFATVQEDDQAGTALGFLGFGGQYVFEQHAFSLAFDLRLNDAGRGGISTEEQIDVGLSYTFTF